MDSSEPPRKRARFSPPALDDEWSSIDAQFLDVLDSMEVEAGQIVNPGLGKKDRSNETPCNALSLSQEPAKENEDSFTIFLQDYTALESHPSRPSKNSDDFPGAYARRAQAIDTTTTAPSGSKYSVGIGFTSVAWAPASALLASQSQHCSRSPSPEAPPERDYSDWFKPAIILNDSFLAPINEAALILPSNTAFQAAAKKLKEWETELEVPSTNPDKPLTSDEQAEEICIGDKALITAPMLLDTPTPIQRVSHHTTNPLARAKAAMAIDTGFRSPSGSTSQAQVHSYHPSHPFAKAAGPLTPKPSMNPLCPSSSFTPQQVKAAVTISSSTPISKQKILGMRTSHRKASQPKFITPFKQGRRPQEFEVGVKSSQLAKASEQKEKDTMLPQTTRPPLVFDLTRFSKRKPLLEQGAPQIYDHSFLPLELYQVDSWTASYFSFHPDLGSGEALRRLKSEGCQLVTKEWVDNHWKLVIWKLAGMIKAWPEFMPQWQFDEVLRQLKYRYEREINRSQRPAVRLIQERDAPASAALVLCVSNINWSTAEDGSQVETQPELELTDGWYFIKARVDEPLARALRKRKLRVGRKIGLAGAWLDAPRKEVMDVLKSLASTHLILTGNSTSLVPWHFKLGFQPRPFVATLGSLTPDGGVVMLLDLVVVKIFPVGYLEMDADGRTAMRNEREERELENQWRDRRAGEESRLRQEVEKRISRLHGLADRLERIAGNQFKSANNDCQPDEIDGLCEELEDADNVSAFMESLSQINAAWLARLLRKKYSPENERIAAELESELNDVCPTRQVRNLRIIRFKDARCLKKPSLRTAQITVWDVLSLGEEMFRNGQRYLVSNLVPNSSGAWQSPHVEGEIYLSTRRDSRWTRVI